MVKDIFFTIDLVYKTVYVGDAVACQDAETLRDFDAVLNATRDIAEPPADAAIAHFLRVPLEDRADQPLDEHWTAALDFIDAQLRARRRLLIHCRAGVSRSVTLLLGYLVARADMSLADAVECVRARRPQMGVNAGFFAQLIALERAAHGVAQPSLTLRDFLLHRLMRLGFARSRALDALAAADDSYERAFAALQRQQKRLSL